MDEILAALGKIPGVKLVCQGWPRNFDTLPCLAVSEGADIPSEWADDLEETTEHAFSIRVFSIAYAECDVLAKLVVAAMGALGYERDEKYDDDSGDVRMKVMRFSRYD